MKKKILVIGGVVLGTFFAATPLLRAHCSPWHTQEEKKEQTETRLRKVKGTSPNTVSSAEGTSVPLVTGVTS